MTKRRAQRGMSAFGGRKKWWTRGRIELPTPRFSVPFPGVACPTLGSPRTPLEIHTESGTKTGPASPDTLSESEEIRAAIAYAELAPALMIRLASNPG
jgi:hypothetical protein